jgi:hypothetical protein
LSLLKENETQAFYVNLYNLLLLDTFITFGGLNEYNLREMIGTPYLKYFQIQDEKFDLKTILEKMETQSLFSCCDFTHQSPKFTFYSKDAEVTQQECKFIEENVKITESEIQLPFCFFKFSNKLQKEEQSTFELSILKYLSKHLSYPFKTPKLTFTFPVLNLFNILNQNNIYKPPNTNFYFNEDQSYGFEITNQFQYIGGFKNHLKEGNGLLIQNDEIVFSGAFHLNRKHGKGIMNIKNILLIGEWENDNSTSIENFN